MVTRTKQLEVAGITGATGTQTPINDNSAVGRAASAARGHNSVTTAASPAGPVGAPKASHVREVLNSLRSRLAVQLEDGDDHDPVMLRALRGNIRSQLEQIDTALQRIDDGKYGICANCVRPIEADRLVVRPYSTLCLDCQNRLDRGKLPR
jgi:RNA polymerase-binding transcription factor DksA